MAQSRARDQLLQSLDSLLETFAAKERHVDTSKATAAQARSQTQQMSSSLIGFNMAAYEQFETSRGTRAENAAAAAKASAGELLVRFEATVRRVPDADPDDVAEIIERARLSLDKLQRRWKKINPT